jgi:NADH dehydrogenase
VPFGRHLCHVSQEHQTVRRILILGSGFAGLYAALRLQKRLAGRKDVEVLLVNRENFFSFTPMLHEVAASDLDLTHIVNPVRKMLSRVQFFLGDVEAVDVAGRTVTVAHGSDGHTHDLPWDHLVVALGSTTNFYGLPGLEEHALTMKSLGDAIALRNRLIANLEEADTECAAMAGARPALTTCVVAGGGFAGVETLASVNDFVREALRYYRNLGPSDLRMVLVHSGPVILPELDERLGRYAQEKLAARGIEVRVGTRVLGVSDEGVRLSDGTTIPTRALVWTAGTSPHPLLTSLPCVKDRGRICVDATLAVPEHPNVWALGDCASIPGPDGAPYPPTAQHALREARVLADNVLATLDGRERRPFRFRTIGQLATIGRRAGVATVFGIRFSGFLAWWLWRTIYLAKLPRVEKKLRVMVDWTLDLLFSKDLVQYTTYRAPTLSLREEPRPRADGPRPSSTPSGEACLTGHA